ncbi:unnamed protein product [Ostreobium quekettii]|uniref:PIH1 N-terminal domain-containing protein n=1 Tax=Ostreobium quekettii TaxID=121088 RepID=A0A8S1IXU4_9CHLO|nr:unnamed protein product [Ostreobium quekettii]
MSCFVIKTTDEALRKVFINVCGCEAVPAPGNWVGGKAPEAVVKALENVDTGVDASVEETLRFPLSCSGPREDVDKKGEPCAVFDCVFNSDVVKQAKCFRSLKRFLIDLCLEWIGQKHKLHLDSKYKLPRMRYKGGTVVSQRIRVDQKPLVEEVGEVDESPSFPLVAKKRSSTSEHPETKSEDISRCKFSFGDNAPNRVPQAARLQAEAKAVQCKTDNGSLPALAWRVHFEGHPVRWIVVTVDVPGDLSLEGCQANVEVSTFNVFVDIAGYAPLTVDIPLAVSCEDCTAQMLEDTRTLTVRLSHRSFSDVLEEMRAVRPHSFGSLDLVSDTYLELEA